MSTANIDMRALRFHSFGALSSVLKIEEIRRPMTRNGDLLVQVKAAAINPSDVKNVQGVFSQTTLPRTPGRDFSGIIITAGEYEGKEIWGTGPGLGMTRDGAHAEYISVPPEFVAPKPDNLSFEEAAAIGVPFTTAWEALIGAGHLAAGETVLIVGAAGAVGSAAVQIAISNGARVLAADIRPTVISGVDAFINTTTADLRERVLNLTAGKGVDLAFDTVGGPMFEPTLRSLRFGGRQIAIASTGGSRVSFDLVEFYHNGAQLIGVDSTKIEASALSRTMAELNRGFEAGSLRPPELQMVPFERAIAGYEQVSAGTGATKQILNFEREQTRR